MRLYEPVWGRRPGRCTWTMSPARILPEKGSRAPVGELRTYERILLLPLSRLLDLINPALII